MIAATASRAVAHLIDARDEIEILEDREVLVEAEALRHVADVAADRVRLADDVVADARPAPASGTSRPHSMRIVVVLPLPLAPRKPQISPFGDLQLRPSTTLRAPKLLRRSSNVDDVVAHGGASARCGRTVTGWPGLSSAACAGGGRASARKTNLPRVDSE